MIDWLWVLGYFKIFAANIHLTDLIIDAIGGKYWALKEYP